MSSLTITPQIHNNPQGIRPLPEPPKNVEGQPIVIPEPSDQYKGWDTYDLIQQLEYMDDAQQDTFINSLSEQQQREMLDFEGYVGIAQDFERRNDANPAEAEKWFMTLPEHVQDQIFKISDIADSSFEEADYVDKQHPDIDFWDRVAIVAFNDTPEDQAAMVRKKYPNLQARVVDNKVMVKNPGSNTAYALEREFSAPWFNKETLADIVEGSPMVPQALLEALTTAAGGVGGLAVGGPPGAVAGLAGGSALGSYLGTGLRHGIGVATDQRGGFNPRQMHQEAMFAAPLGPIFGSGAIPKFVGKGGQALARKTAQVTGRDVSEELLAKLTKEITPFEKARDWTRESTSALADFVGSTFGGPRFDDRETYRNISRRLKQMRDYAFANVKGKFLRGKNMNSAGYRDPVVKLAKDFKEDLSKGLDLIRDKIGTQMGDMIDGVGGVDLSGPMKFVDDQIAALKNKNPDWRSQPAVRDEINGWRETRDLFFGERQRNPAFDDTFTPKPADTESGAVRLRSGLLSLYGHPDEDIPKFLPRDPIFDGNYFSSLRKRVSSDLSRLGKKEDKTPIEGYVFTNIATVNDLINKEIDLATQSIGDLPGLRKKYRDIMNLRTQLRRARMVRRAKDGSGYEIVDPEEMVKPEDIGIDTTKYTSMITEDGLSAASIGYTSPELVENFVKSVKKDVDSGVIKIKEGEEKIFANLFSTPERQREMHALRDWGASDMTKLPGFQRNQLANAKESAVKSVGAAAAGMGMGTLVSQSPLVGLLTAAVSTLPTATQHPGFVKMRIDGIKKLMDKAGASGPVQSQALKRMLADYLAETQSENVPMEMGGRSAMFKKGMDWSSHQGQMLLDALMENQGGK